MATVKENLVAAKALIDTPEKWGREEYKDTLTGCMCAVGAVAEVTGLSPGSAEGRTDEVRALAAALPKEWEPHVAYITSYNDLRSTTHADIMALFDRAIAAEEAKESGA